MQVLVFLFRCLFLAFFASRSFASSLHLPFTPPPFHSTSFSRYLLFTPPPFHSTSFSLHLLLTPPPFHSTSFSLHLLFTPPLHSSGDLPDAALLPFATYFTLFAPTASSAAS
jgi:hypothetical protein